MALEIDRLRLTPERPGVYRLLLSWQAEDGEMLEQAYDIMVVASQR